ncbi:MAG: HPF/RaiA family ribosome-associated protein [Chromatiales bacterium]|nr:HPF/RaiA family ribosome-associated protein [Chromatiales bacterium]
MQLPLQITYRHMEKSEALDTRIRERADKLEQFAPNIMSCRVVVDAPHQHKHKGVHYRISVDVTLPGHEIAVTRSPDQHGAHEDPYVVVRDVFDALERQLEETMRRRKQQVKHHETPPHGQVTSLVPMEDYGRILTSDGRDIYFHRNSVLNADFERLEIGDEVRFDEEQGEQGPKATTVRVIGKHHILG